MSKAPYLPKDEPGKRKWLTNWAAKLPTYAATVGVTAAEVTQAAADSAFFNYVCDAHAQHTKTTRDWTAYKHAAAHGDALGNLPTTPALGTAPATVPPDIFGRNCALAGRIKKHPSYTEAMGQDLGIIGAEQTIDYSSLKPVLNITLQAGHPVIDWHKQGMDSLELWADRGDGKGFIFLAIDSVPLYTDTAALPAPGAGAVWKYKGIYREADAQVGQWSDVVSIAVAG
jgi:hypothetical protein